MIFTTNERTNENSIKVKYVIHEYKLFNNKLSQHTATLAQHVSLHTYLQKNVHIHLQLLSAIKNYSLYTKINYLHVV